MGISGFDELLKGGLPQNHLYLLMGKPGSGKTTMGLQFLQEGVRQNERVLYITLLHSEEELREIAASHGWNLAGIDVRILISESENESVFAEQTILPSFEVQLNDVMAAIEKAIEDVRPVRMVFDSIEQVRLLAGDPVIYRQKVLTMQRLLNKRNVTSIFVETSDQSPEFKTLAHGVFLLDTVVPTFGEINRRLRIEKVRGIDFSSGFHSYRICTGGIEIYPRVPITKQKQHPEWWLVQSGIDQLDAMLGGGLAEGMACMISGEAGTGKSSLAVAYASAAAKNGKNSTIFLFDERKDLYLKRAQGMGMDLQPLIKQGLLTIRQISIGDMSAGELAYVIRREVEDRGIKVLVLDSLSGFFQALPEEPQLLTQLHDLLIFLGQNNVLSLLIFTEHGIIGPKSWSADASYISDSVILLRRFEAMGEIRIAVVVAKQRLSDHEKHIREMRLTSKGIEVGEPLRDFQGILTGTPAYTGRIEQLMDMSQDAK
jgi:circadian clock protein KaiC